MRSIFNKFFFLLFQISRCIKNVSLRPLKDLEYKTNHLRDQNYHIKSNAGFGYQLFIQKSYLKNLKTHFPEVYDEVLIKKLFPEQEKDLEDTIQKLDPKIYKTLNRDSAKI